MVRTLPRLFAAALLVGVVAAGCSSTSPTSTTATTSPPGTPSTTAGVNGSAVATTSGGSTGTTGGTAAGSTTLRILVTDDDGVGAAGIDAVVEGLRKLPNTEVTVVAPLTNQSGTGGKTTDGPLTVSDATTASGYKAKAVTGFPADTIVWAIDQNGIAERPHVVVSGINIGQNVGPVSEISGTVGAARAAATRGIPALASSQGLATTLDFPSGVKLVTEWVEKHRAELLASTTTGTTAKAAAVFNLNIPTCVTGTLRPLVEVPVATDLAGRDIAMSDCVTPFPNPKDDIDAFIHGYPSLSPLTATATGG
jgi:5'-nucleotidase